jgi:ribosomal protein S18 acetylase RimI-like enzyme
MSVTIRAAVLGDEQRLAVLNSCVQELHVANRPDSFKPSDLGEIAEWFRTFLRSASAHIWIAEEQGEAVGYVTSLVRERPENPFCRSHRWCEIDQIAVDPRFRRRGIARALIQKAVATAAAEEISMVELVTWAFNEEAQVTFRKLGFVPKLVRWEL